MSPSPSTPISRYPLHQTFRPLNSSPLASPSSSRSPSATHKPIPESRRLQFKAQTPTSSISRSRTLPSSSSSARHVSSSRTRSIPSSGSASTLSGSSSKHVTRSPFNHPEDPQKQFFRERIKAKCLERAQKARARAVKNRRYTGYSDRSSDGFDMEDDDDEEEDDDDIMGDELFRRIMAQTNRKTDHSYRLSYALEVGSSFDPDIEDVAEWEREVQSAPNQDPDPLPVDLNEDEELEAYAEECARQAALEEFADIPEEELFHLSDIDDVLNRDQNRADDMDIS